MLHAEKCIELLPCKQAEASVAALTEQCVKFSRHTSACLFTRVCIKLVYCSDLLNPRSCLLQKMMKVKASNKFSFPLSLDFAPYQSSSAAAHDAGSQQYDLQAILIHKGPSASQGHYGEL